MELSNEWIIEKVENNLTIARRRNTKKRIGVFDGYIDKEKEKNLLRFWTIWGIHPFIYKDGKYYDLLFGDIINQI